jgi:hypothetical protein
MNEILDEDIFEKTAREKKTFKIKVLPSIVWISIFFLGYITKMFDWPGQYLFIIIGASGFMAYNIFHAKRSKGDQQLTKTAVLISILWFAYILYGVCFNEGDPINTSGLILHVALFVAFYLFYGFLELIRKKPKTTPSERPANQHQKQPHH